MFRNLILTIAALLLITSCSSNQHNAEKIDTTLEKSEMITNENLGVKDGNMVVQKKVMMTEELRALQYSVYELEDRVYGSRKFGSQGLYGVLKDCKMQISEKSNGGDGKLIWMEPLDRVTDKEEKFDIGLDDKDRIVGLQEEFLKDRISRFNRYKDILMKRQDEFNEKVDICKTEVKSRRFDVDSKKKAAQIE